MPFPSGRIVLVWLMVSLAVLASAGPVQAQAADRRLLVGASVGNQVATRQRLETVDFELFQEQGTFDSQYKISSDWIFDGGGSMRFWRRAGLGVFVSTFRTTSTATTEAQVPHPHFFGLPRVASGTASSLKRRELAVHVQGQYWLPVRNWLLLTGFYGPTFFRVKQDQVAGIQTAEEFPFEQVVMVGHRAVTASETAIGYNIGFEATFFNLGDASESDTILDRLGLAFQLRYSRGTSPVQLKGNDQPALELGGLHVMGGIRVGF